MNSNIQRRLFQGFVCLFILKMADSNKLYGAMMLDELEQAGYRLSPGTLYPILRQLQQDNMIVSCEDAATGKTRRFFKITAHGRKSLSESLEYLDFLNDCMSREFSFSITESCKTGTDNV